MIFTPALNNAMALLGRVMIAMLFIPGGISKLTGFAGTVGYIASKGVPLPEVCAAIAIIVELGLGIALLVGWKTRSAALAIAIFTVVITFIFHAFWAVPAEQVMMQKMSFFKNIAIAGGLYAFAAFGPGAWSVDAKTGNAA